MVSSNTWGHSDTTTGVSYLTFLNKYNFDTISNGTYYGENLNGSFTYTTAQAVVNAWYNEINSTDQNHKTNILDANFQYMGFAECKNTNTASKYINEKYYVQLFWGYIKPQQTTPKAPAYEWNDCSSYPGCSGYNGP